MCSGSCNSARAARRLVRQMCAFGRTPMCALDRTGSRSQGDRAGRGKVGRALRVPESHRLPSRTLRQSPDVPLALTDPSLTSARKARARCPGYSTKATVAPIGTEMGGSYRPSTVLCDP